MDLFNELKLRASYGQTGNQEGIGLYDYLQLINIGGLLSVWRRYPNTICIVAGMVSTNRTWETLINKNIGIDATLFKQT